MLNSSFRYKRLAGGILDFGEDINDIVSKMGSDSGGISSHDGSKNDTDSDCNTEPWIILEFLHPSTEKACSYIIINWLGTMGVMHDNVLLISFTTTPRSHVVSARFFHISCWYSFQFLSSGSTFTFCILAWW